MKIIILKILLVDDEPEALDLLENLLITKEGVEVVGKAENKTQALEQMIRNQPDVIFQDIQMGETNGLEMVDEYRKHHFNGKIVFVTAYSQYAIDAIRKAAYDYLLKPVDMDDLDALILRLMSEQNMPDSGKGSLTKLKIPTRTGYSLINMNEIVFCQADGNYTDIFSNENEPTLTSMNLGKIEDKLPKDIFFRISRSVIININFLTTMNKGEKICLLKVCGKKHRFNISSQKIKELENMV